MQTSVILVLVCSRCSGEDESASIWCTPLYYEDCLLIYFTELSMYSEFETVSTFYYALEITWFMVAPYLLKTILFVWYNNWFYKIYHYSSIMKDFLWTRVAHVHFNKFKKGMRKPWSTSNKARGTITWYSIRPKMDDTFNIMFGHLFYSIFLQIVK